MSNLMGELRSEIARLARKELRSQIRKLSKAGAQFRRDIAALKRAVRQHERQVEFLMRQEQTRVASLPPVPEAGKQIRFSPKWLHKHRAKLGLSAKDYAKLIGVSMRSIYHWEQGKSKPRPAQVNLLAGLRQLRKREALQRLQLVAGKETKRPKRRARRARRAKK